MLVSERGCQKVEPASARRTKKFMLVRRGCSAV